MISVVFPLYIPSETHKKMTDKNIYLAKTKTSLKHEWVIVETASSYYLEEADVYIYEKKRTSPVHSINRAFKVANNDYIAYLSNDVTVCDGWLEKMMDCFKKHSDCGIASIGNNEHNDEIRNEIIEGFYFSVCMLRKPDAWYSIDYKTNFLDTDLAFRIHRQGKKFYKNLSGKVFHQPHSTVGKFSGDIEDYEKSRRTFLNKWKLYADDPLYKTFGGI